MDELEATIARRVTGVRRTRRLLAVTCVAVGLLAAACGGDDDGGTEGGTGGSTTPTSPATETSRGGSASTTTAAADDVDPDGVMRIAVDLTASGGIDLDPIDMDSPTDFHIHYNIYDTLLRQREDGSYEPGLAKEAAIVDPSTIEVELQEGVKFQDGTDVDAEAVKFSIERTVAVNKLAPFRMAELGQIASLDVVDPLHLTIRLKQPIAGSFYNLLAHNETIVVSPTAVRNGVDLNKQPVGAGPFKLESYAREASLKLVKWDGYFQADEIRLAGIEYVQAPAANVATALRGGLVDVAQITHDVATQLGGSGFEVRSEKSPNAAGFVSLQCPTNPPLQDVRVRQALNFATDKEGLNQALFQGEGEPMSQFWTSDTPYYDPGLAHVYDHDVAKAKALLAEAGASDLSMTMAISPGQSQRMGELLQGQWGEAGVDLQLIPVSNVIQDYFLDKKLSSLPQVQTRLWTDKLTRNFAPGTTGNTCDVKDPAFLDKLLQLRGYGPDSAEAAGLWKQLSKVVNDNAWVVFMAMGTVDNAWDDDVLGNPTWRPTQLGALWPDVHAVYVKA